MSVSKEFVLAGDAYFTIETPDDHYTYKVYVQPANDRWPQKIFVRYFTGTENTDPRSYSYLGVLDPFTGQTRTTEKSKRFEGSLCLSTLNKVLARIWSGSHDYEREGIKTHHIGLCGRCGRLLTNPKSITTGIGPECARIMGVA